jgi:hypothetical protein
VTIPRARSGNDLKVEVLGTSDWATLVGWYLNQYSQLAKIVAGDGKVLDAGLNSLADAMTTAMPPATPRSTPSRPGRRCRPSCNPSSPLWR